MRAVLGFVGLVTALTLDVRSAVLAQVSAMHTLRYWPPLLCYDFERSICHVSVSQTLAHGPAMRGWGAELEWRVDNHSTSCAGELTLVIAATDSVAANARLTC